MITQAIINHPRFDETDLSTVRLVNETGAAGDDPRRPAEFGAAPVVTLFGMTETSGGITWGAPTDDEEKRITTGGFPLHGTEVRVVDPETDEDLPPETPARSSSAGRGSSSGTTTTPRRPPRRCAAAGSTRATAASSTRTAA